MRGLLGVPARPSISVFVPAYNEGPRIRASVTTLEALLAGAFDRYEVVVVDDGSTDDTADQVLAVASAHVGLRRFSPGRSWRENLAVAMLEAASDVVAFVDADLSPDIGALPTLVAALQAGADVAVGSRRLAASECERRRLRKVVSAVYNGSLRWLFASPVHDCQCGLKAFRPAVLRRLVGEMGAPGRLRRGWFWDGELLIRARRAGYRVVEVPVRWLESPSSSYFLPAQVALIPYILWLRVRLLLSSRPDRD
jgi:glycosyltransferase involved in cell wall biosynthesis